MLFELLDLHHWSLQLYHPQRRAPVMVGAGGPLAELVPASTAPEPGLMLRELL